jgi:hypothetical protein
MVIFAVVAVGTNENQAELLFWPFHEHPFTELPGN